MKSKNILLIALFFTGILSFAGTKKESNPNPENSAPISLDKWSGLFGADARRMGRSRANAAGRGLTMPTPAAITDRAA